MKSIDPCCREWQVMNGESEIQCDCMIFIDCDDQSVIWIAYNFVQSKRSIQGEKKYLWRRQSLIGFIVCLFVPFFFLFWNLIANFAGFPKNYEFRTQDEFVVIIHCLTNIIHWWSMIQTLASEIRFNRLDIYHNSWSFWIVSGTNRVKYLLNRKGQYLFAFLYLIFF